MKTKNEINDQLLVRLQMGWSSTFDPVLLSETVGKEITDNVYERLVFYEKNSFSSFTPMLASGWDISKDKTRYIFYIREKVFFHDGEMLNAHTIAMSLNRAIRLCRHDIFRQMLSDICITEIDNFTLSITLNNPYSGFLHFLALQESSIISPKIFYNRKENEISKLLECTAIGTGPFKLGQIIVNKKIELIRNDEYWGEKASLKKVQIIFEDDIEKRKNIFLNGFSDISIDEGQNINIYNSFKSITVESNRSLDISFLTFNFQNKYLQNYWIRKALIQSFDTATYIKDKRKGYGYYIKGLIPNGLLGYSDQLIENKYDLKMARKSIHESNVDLHMLSPLKVLFPLGNGKDSYVNDQWINNLSKLGIEVDFIEIKWLDYLKALEQGNFDICLISWAPDYPDPDNYITQFFHSKGEIARISRLMDCFGSFIDVLIEKAREETNSPNRELLYKIIQQICINLCLYIPLHQARDIKLFWNYVKGVEYNPLYGDYYFRPIYKIIKNK